MAAESPTMESPMKESPYKQANASEEGGGELAQVLQKRRLLTEGERLEMKSALKDIVTDETAALRKELETHRAELEKQRLDLEMAHTRASGAERRASRGKSLIHKLENLWLDAPTHIQERLQQVMMENQMTPRGEMESPRKCSTVLQSTPEDREFSGGLPSFAPQPRGSARGTPASLNSETVSTPPAGTSSKPPGMPSVPLQLISGSALQSQQSQQQQDRRVSNVSAATAEHRMDSSEESDSDSDASNDEKVQEPIGTITVSPEHYQQMLHSARDADKAKADYEMRMQMLADKGKGCSSSDSPGTAENQSEALQRLEEALAREADARAELERALAGLCEEQAWHGLPPPQGVLAAPLFLSGPGSVPSVGGSPVRARPAANRLADLTSPQTVWWRGNGPGHDTAVSA
eukprot:gnl/MRDRNA2_/MRDRNA2_127298_c0_seq1.p1 gnl/MRDRNA2_/MRDRNA2_127298_c0~~gnl/MRDRNA2_/MRDRNA2_127298_c0_seq1.p1  ORF type:complete len:406 (+),score=103.37 gnl/MRDRNA2_/MRDRNA2_127298_c0_seq1:112-1329(+)